VTSMDYNDLGLHQSATIYVRFLNDETVPPGDYNCTVLTDNDCHSVACSATADPPPPIRE